MHPFKHRPIDILLGVASSVDDCDHAAAPLRLKTKVESDCLLIGYQIIYVSECTAARLWPLHNGLHHFL